jgi:hypothetical protein
LLPSEAAPGPVASATLVKSLVVILEHRSRNSRSTLNLSRKLLRASQFHAKVDDHTAPQAEEMLAFPRGACLLGLATRVDGEHHQRIQLFSLLTSSSLEPIYSLLTERNVIGQDLCITSQFEERA